jgi:hypothetical protein
MTWVDLNVNIQDGYAVHTLAAPPTFRKGTAAAEKFQGAATVSLQSLPQQLHKVANKRRRHC